MTSSIMLCCIRVWLIPVVMRVIDRFFLCAFMNKSCYMHTRVLACMSETV